MEDRSFVKTCNIALSVCAVVLIILVSQIALQAFQLSRYKEDVYDCSDMSLDCANFFTSIGIKTRYVHGWYYDNSEYGKAFHVWLELDFGFFKLPFESTQLMFISPSSVQDYDEIKIMDNYSTNITEIWGNDIDTR